MMAVTKTQNVYIERTWRFQAAHWLPLVKEGHKCGRMHGHSYQLTATFRAPIWAQQGMIADFGDLDAAFRPFIDANFEHRVLNQWHDNPTSENLAWRFLAEAAPVLIANAVTEGLLPAGIMCVQVRLAETERSAAVVTFDA